ncbi:hypothetical protein BU25DRAFT_76033 [Macroventuria anomochaeta]|uniref:Uncharacterized protein n=1 Tax=Macroventuria anomochaeta TaxID=301207 RepID=A0ACB6RYX0_9PLEO|nr:uncharacterized protein BU25DRAFT_76033 [Macroventuria anomochaeta]KAF2626974.1 hypothetical protein BU25DRAFT_76033 [Macroventuria anomochaeta]
MVPAKEAMTAMGREFDNMIWAELSDLTEYVDDLPVDIDARTPLPSMRPMQWLFQFSQSTLTRLDLDWILWRQQEHNDKVDGSSEFLKDLTVTRLPHLIAFQIRNAVLPMIKLPNDVSHLEDTFLTFLEEHPKIECLAWPLDKFYNYIRPSLETQNRY